MGRLVPGTPSAISFERLVSKGVVDQDHATSHNPAGVQLYRRANRARAPSSPRPPRASAPCDRSPADLAEAPCVQADVSVGSKWPRGGRAKLMFGDRAQVSEASPRDRSPFNVGLRLLGVYPDARASIHEITPRASGGDWHACCAHLLHALHLRACRLVPHPDPLGSVGAGRGPRGASAGGQLDLGRV